MTARAFVPHGPQIPAAVLQALDEDRLVFFCGAGISIGTGLPDFSQLVLDAFRACRVSLESEPAAREAYDQGHYDKALEILENAEGERPGSMRRAVMGRLLTPPRGIQA